MKRTLTICAVSALIMGASIPTSALPGTSQVAFAEAGSAAAAASGRTAKPQAIVASAAVTAPASRDAFGITAPPPPPELEPVAVARYSAATSNVTGALAVWPASGGVNDGFGYRGTEFHGGIDIMAGYGSPIVAASPGVVIAVTQDGGWGQYVQVDHGGGITTLYAHMISGSPLVSAGQSVAAGQQLGSVGDTGYVTVAHLHFEVWVNGTKTDPMGWLP
ncbi:M23 family metallopeptidase [Salinibacterium sp.]|uniref:M23 family metallopeptidase n=1 Tax=Salinibacterium sp. TaxID=1915057 RepID=UPI00286CF201|nr:M23 family metallopeptidase [Salinibacterium sp.]